MNEIDFINTNHPLNLEQEFGSGYIRFTDGYFDENTGGYGMIGQVLDENHNTLGPLTVGGYVCHFHHDDHKVNLQYLMEVNLEGDMEKILSLKKGI
ncbi:hypothetical protein [Wolbachia endosymbiont (group A) of Bibio marci]|uniref:hypothetical protein n=1 Tax=Wolbachia endosymbiont (group A) of Bibio marci TaxID=2953987 RepID=UPI00222F44CA|nr:hypothetical protein [Wolbachia endosymbiont (group A) of Bibio marci]